MYYYMFTEEEYSDYNVNGMYQTPIRLTQTEIDELAIDYIKECYGLDVDAEKAKRAVNDRFAAYYVLFDKDMCNLTQEEKEEDSNFYIEALSKISFVSWLAKSGRINLVEYSEIWELNILEGD